jgi:hypothetical protein
MGLNVECCSGQGSSLLGSFASSDYVAMNLATGNMAEAVKAA